MGGTHQGRIGGNRGIGLGEEGPAALAQAHRGPGSWPGPIEGVIGLLQVMNMGMYNHMDFSKR